MCIYKSLKLALFGCDASNPATVRASLSVLEYVNGTGPRTPLQFASSSFKTSSTQRLDCNVS